MEGQQLDEQTLETFARVWLDDQRKQPLSEQDQASHKIIDSALTKAATQEGLSVEEYVRQLAAKDITRHVTEDPPLILPTNFKPQNLLTKIRAFISRSQG